MCVARRRASERSKPLANITYTRTFQHTDWQDNVDRVQAGGGTGFNKHFHDIEGDFDALSQVVSQINAALIALGQQPTPQPIRINLTPTLVPIDSSPGWLHNSGEAFFKRIDPLKDPTTTSGMMSVDLPEKVRITTFRATGQNASTTALVRVSLFRQTIQASGIPPERIARVAGDANPFDNSAAADPNLARVDKDRFKYFIVAFVDSMQVGDDISLSGFQIVYIAD